MFGHAGKLVNMHVCTHTHTHTGRTQMTLEYVAQVFFFFFLCCFFSENGLSYKQSNVGGHKQHFHNVRQMRHNELDSISKLH